MTTTKMRPFRDTIPLHEARSLIDGAIRPLDRRERVPLSDANGRVLASDAAATADVPPFARAAMDGYAVRAADTQGASRAQPKTLVCIEKVFTGQMPARQVGAGECTEIATGAPMPPGADAVVMVEETDPETSGGVRVFAPGLRFKMPWHRVHKVSAMEQSIDLSHTREGLRAMAADGMALQFDANLRFEADREHLERFLFALEAPMPHVTGVFTCLLRNEIANVGAAGTEDSYGLIRRERGNISTRCSTGPPRAVCRQPVSAGPAAQPFGCMWTETW